ncbi:MFS transporter [Mycolicibacterium confluentis]|uniref:MFS transporter n=1 Tax=Mycolicibacterium confluentis TaxID=28047 RepID=UPI0021F253DA|nr:MFS transporter [Mycolicibacterium confluentis]
MGFFCLGALIAFEMMAVATVMPVVAADLGGVEMYALAFAVPMAVSIVALTMSGSWMDRRGLLTPIAVGVAIFSAGLIVSGVASTILQFLIGRGIFGFGAGILTVAMFVLIARCYPPEQRPTMFALYTSTFMVAALAGPAVAGAVADHVGWRWVFLLVPGLALVAAGLLYRAVAPVGGNSDARSGSRRSLVWAVVAGAGILGLSVAGQRGLPAWPVLLAGSVVTVAVAVPRLLPAGTWALRPGLPSTIAARGLIGAAFLSAESYLPLALTEFRGCSPTLAGAILTASAVAWFAGTSMCARLKVLGHKPLRLAIGMTLIAAGLMVVMLIPVDAVPLAVVIAGWGLGALGMGMTLPTLAMAVLDRSKPDEVGVNSAATHLNDAVSQAFVLAVGSVLFGALLTASAPAAFVSVVGLSVALLMAGILPLTRIGAGQGA